MDQPAEDQGAADRSALAPDDESDLMRDDESDLMRDDESDLMRDGESDLMRRQDPWIGRTIGGRYRIRERLGQGGMGVVYLAEHTLLKKLVALKALTGTAALSSEATRRFMREAQVAASVGHQHIAGATDVGILESGELYLVLEYLEGQDLGDLVHNSGALRVHHALQLLMQLCDGMQAVHSVGIVHRDLKPENIFVTRRHGVDFVKVLDFGVCKVQQPLTAVTNEVLTRSGATLGTPNYMSPEQTMAAANVDGRSDVYAIGATAFFMLTGSPPFAASSLPELFQRICHDTPQRVGALRRDVPEALCAAITKALAKDPAERFADAAELKRAFKQAEAELALDRTRQTSEQDLAAPVVDPRDGQNAIETAPLSARVPNRQRRLPWTGALSGRVLAVAGTCLALAVAGALATAPFLKGAWSAAPAALSEPAGRPRPRTQDDPITPAPVGMAAAATAAPAAATVSGVVPNAGSDAERTNQHTQGARPTSMVAATTAAKKATPAKKARMRRAKRVAPSTQPTTVAVAEASTAALAVQSPPTLAAAPSPAPGASDTRPSSAQVPAAPAVATVDAARGGLVAAREPSSSPGKAVQAPAPTPPQPNAKNAASAGYRLSARRLRKVFDAPVSPPGP